MELGLGYFLRLIIITSRIYFTSFETTLAIYTVDIRVFETWQFWQGLIAQQLKITALKVTKLLKNTVN